jgi:hypothetical protein
MHDYSWQQSHMHSVRRGLQSLQRSFGTRSTPVRLTDQQSLVSDHRTISPAAAHSSRCNSQKKSVQSHQIHTSKPAHLRRALLGGILLSVGAMPFSSTRVSRASAAEFTVEKVMNKSTGLCHYSQIDHVSHIHISFVISHSMAVQVYMGSKVTVHNVQKRW